MAYWLLILSHCRGSTSLARNGCVGKGDAVYWAMVKKWKEKENGIVRLVRRPPPHYCYPNQNTSKFQTAYCIDHCYHHHHHYYLGLIKSTSIIKSWWCKYPFDHLSMPWCSGGSGGWCPMSQLSHETRPIVTFSRGFWRSQLASRVKVMVLSKHRISNGIFQRISL